MELADRRRELRARIMNEMTQPVPGLTPAQKIGGVLNDRSGSFANSGNLRDDAERLLADQGFASDLRLAREGDLEAQFHEVAQSSDILLAAGGDGTILAGASIAYALEKTLLIVPTGTMNIFARDLGVPPGLDALSRLGEAETRPVDVGMVNGQMFLNCVAIGSFVRITSAREALRESNDLLHAWADYSSEMVRLLTGVGKRRLKWRELGRRHWRRSGAMIFANNPVSGSFPNFLDRPALDTGRLASYIFASPGLALPLVSGLLPGGARDRAPPVEREERASFFLDFPKSSMRAVVDGEIRTLTSPMQLECKPRALKVLVPPGGKSR